MIVIFFCDQTTFQKWEVIWSFFYEVVWKGSQQLQVWTHSSAILSDPKMLQETQNIVVLLSYPHESFCNI